jgi:hypothetical protein
VTSLWHEFFNEPRLGPGPHAPHEQTKTPELLGFGKPNRLLKDLVDSGFFRLRSYVHHPTVIPSLLGGVPIGVAGSIWLLWTGGAA